MRGGDVQSVEATKQIQTKTNIHEQTVDSVNKSVSSYENKANCRDKCDSQNIRKTGIQCTEDTQATTIINFYVIFLKSNLRQDSRRCQLGKARSPVETNCRCRGRECQTALRSRVVDP